MATKNKNTNSDKQRVVMTSESDKSLPPTQKKPPMPTVKQSKPSK